MRFVRRSGFSSYALWLVPAITIMLLSACESGTPPTPTAIQPTATAQIAPPTSTPEPIAEATVEPTATPSPIPASERKYVPILCYHYIREWEPADRPDDKAYVVPPSMLEEALKYLKENGYQGVTSEQVYEYYANGRPLPEKPVMLSFDDNIDNQYTNAVPLLRKYGFTATYFVMTVTLDKENFMTSDQLVELDREGFDIQPHTWDHVMVTEYNTEEDWQKQAVEPKRRLEELLGHPTPLFAYPFGVYDAESVEKLKSYGYKGAFRLRDVMDEDTDPLFAIKRYIANPFWTQEQFEAVITGKWEE